MSHSGQGDPASFDLPGGEVGVLLIHGFTGSPAEMRPIGQYLNERGLTVLAPLLPGHGTQIEDMNQVNWSQWTAAVEQALADLQDRCRTTFVAGLSMGGLLTLYLASRHPELPGIVTYAAALDISDWRLHFAPFIKGLLKTVPKPVEHWANPEAEKLIWSYERYPVGGAAQLLALRAEVEAALPRITSPTLVTFSTADVSVSPRGAQMIVDRISSADKQVVQMNDCGHVMTVDEGWDELARLTHQFITEHVPQQASG